MTIVARVDTIYGLGNSVDWKTMASGRRPRVGMYMTLGLVLSVLCVAPFATALAKEIVVGFGYAKPPYVFAQSQMQTGETRGIELDIVRKALAHRGHTFRPRYFAYNHLGDALKSGRVDAIATVRPELQGAYYSDDFVYFQNFAITRPDPDPPLQDIDSLSSRTITAWQGATKDLGSDFERVVFNSQLYREIGDQQQQVLLFLQHRVNTVVIDGAIFRYWARILGHNPDDYVFHNIFGAKTMFVVGFRSEEMRDDFNAGLKQLHDDNEYDEIYKKYGRP